MIGGGVSRGRHRSYHHQHNRPPSLQPRPPDYFRHQSQHLAAPWPQIRYVNLLNFRPIFDINEMFPYCRGSTSSTTLPPPPPAPQQQQQQQQQQQRHRPYSIPRPTTLVLYTPFHYIHFFNHIGFFPRDIKGGQPTPGFKRL